MFQTLARKRALRGRPDLSRFVPQAQVARVQVDHLVARGARVVSVGRDRVVLQRGDAKAEIDALGRVTWCV